MFKLRCNNKIIKEYNSLLEAKLGTLLTLKKTPSLKLIEVLDNDDEVIFQKEVKEPTQEQIEVGVDTVIRNLITRFYDDITEVESAKVSLEDKGVDATTFDIFEEIVDDLHLHIGSLESCLSDNIE